MFKKNLPKLLVATLLSTFAVGGITSSAIAEVQLGDWTGSYRGFIDGRKATLRIIYHSVRGDCTDRYTSSSVTSRPYFTVELRDIERSVVWSRNCIDAFGRLSPGHDGRPKHIWPNMNLKNRNSGVEENVGNFYLHTWNKGFISGSNEWNGSRFGRFFMKNDRTIGNCSSGDIELGSCRF